MGSSSAVRSIARVLTGGTVGQNKIKSPKNPKLAAEEGVDEAGEEERKKRLRRANTFTTPLGSLVQRALQTRNLTGQ